MLIKNLSRNRANIAFKWMFIASNFVPYQQHRVYCHTGLQVISPKSISTRLKLGCQLGCFWRWQRRVHFLSLQPLSEDCLHSLVHGAFLHLQSQQWLPEWFSCDNTALHPSPISKHLCDDLRPTHTIQGDCPISGSFTSSHLLSLFCRGKWHIPSLQGLLFCLPWPPMICIYPIYM